MALTAVKSIVFTDLDGTLLTHDTYSFEPALDMVGLLGEKEIPLLFCSSKTRAEIEHYRQRLHNSHPFITENGGGIFIPKDGLPKEYLPPHETLEDYYLVRLGENYANLCRAIGRLRSFGFDVKGFGDMSAEEISALTGLGPQEALLSKQREFDEPFVYSGSPEKTDVLIREIESMGLRHTEGSYHHIMGSSDKGQAVRITTEIYRKLCKEGICTIGLGDSLNDLPMLEAVDIAVVMQKPDGSYDGRLLGVKNHLKARAPGPRGWSLALRDILCSGD